MTDRMLLLVGSRFDAIIEALAGGEFRVVTASDAFSVLDALDGKAPEVVLINADDLDAKLRLLRALAAELVDDPIPILVALEPDDAISRDEVVRQGASDCFCLTDDGMDLVSRLQLLCKVRALAATVLNQHAMIERHVESVLASREEVRQVRAELEALLEHGPLIMYSAEAPADPGEFLSVEEIERADLTHLDKTVYTLLGYSAQELLGDAQVWRRLVPSKDLARLATRAKRLFAQGHHACHYRMRHADGRVRWVSDEARLLRRDDGAAVAVLGCLRDVTRERNVSDAMKRNHGLLQSAQRMQGAQRLAGTVAHDFNNMLAVIMCHAQLAARQLPTDHAAQKSLDSMIEAAIRAKAGTKLLVQLAQRTERKVAPANVNAMIRDTVKLVGPLLGQAISVTTKLRSNLPKVRIDRVDLEHALLNLCVNARDAMPTGGSLTIRTDLRQIADEQDHLTTSVLIEVADTGMGMDDRAIKRCFEPFFTTKPQGEGTGLGLFSVLQTVRQSGGAVAVETEQGNGTTFRIMLPAVEVRKSAHDSVEAPVSGTRVVKRRVERPAVKQQVRICEPGPAVTDYVIDGSSADSPFPGAG